MSRSSGIRRLALSALVLLAACQASGTGATGSSLELRVAELEAELAEAQQPIVTTTLDPATSTSTTVLPATTTTLSETQQIAAWGDGYHGLTLAYIIELLVDHANFYWDLAASDLLGEPDLVVGSCYFDLETLAEPARGSQATLNREYPSDLLELGRPELTVENMTLGDQMYLSPLTSPSEEVRIALGAVVDADFVLLSGCVRNYVIEEAQVDRFVSAIEGLGIVASEAGLPTLYRVTAQLQEPLVEPGFELPAPVPDSSASLSRVHEIDLNSALNRAAQELMGRTAVNSQSEFLDWFRSQEDEAAASGMFSPDPSAAASVFLYERFGSEIDEYQLLLRLMFVDCMIEGRSDCSY